MKSENLPLIIFIVFNLIFAASFLYFFGLPSYRTLTAGLDALSLQERMFEIKSSDFSAYADNLLLRDEIKTDLSEGDAVIGEQSDAAAFISEMLSFAANIRLTRTSFYMDEVEVYEAAENSVCIHEIYSEYTGAYEDLCELARFATESKLPARESVSITNADGVTTMTIEFTIYTLLK